MFNQANIGTVSMATLGRLLRDGAERVWAFPSAAMPSLAETETETRLCPSTVGCSPPSMPSIVLCLLLSCSRRFPPCAGTRPWNLQGCEIPPRPEGPGYTTAMIPRALPFPQVEAVCAGFLVRRPKLTPFTATRYQLRDATVAAGRGPVLTRWTVFHFVQLWGGA